MRVFMMMPSIKLDAKWLNEAQNKWKVRLQSKFWFEFQFPFLAICKKQSARRRHDYEGFVSIVVEAQTIQINILSTKSPLNSLPIFCPLWRSCDICSWSTKNLSTYYRCSPLEWPLLQWHSGYSDKIMRSQMAFLIVNMHGYSDVCLQWHFGPGQTVSL